MPETSGPLKETSQHSPPEGLHLCTDCLRLSLNKVTAARFLLNKCWASFSDVLGGGVQSQERAGSLPSPWRSNISCSSRHNSTRGNTCVVFLCRWIRCYTNKTQFLSEKRSSPIRFAAVGFLDRSPELHLHKSHRL